MQKILYSILLIILFISCQKTSEKINPLEIGENLIDTFFSPESEIVSNENNAYLIHRIAVYYAVAIDDNLVALKSKARCINAAHTATLILLVALSVFLSAVILLELIQSNGVTK